MKLLRGQEQGPLADPAAVGMALAHTLRLRGADRLLREVRGAHRNDDTPAVSLP